MGQEIERKYLVDFDKWSQTPKPEGARYRQGYLLTDPQKTIRVRQTPDKGFLTIKGISVGATRAEYEYQIPYQEAEELLAMFSVSELSKTRYKILFKGKIWEVDEFAGDNAGLIVAEIELTSEAEHFELPDWVGREVTGQQEYYNSNLTIHPYKNWNK
ncbi:adenylate cyclase [Taibaiella sp. KBW10]|uniref:CYTH domain-containing protein n=1 Tax=Taibaiella sp. KBW10 TaxID=2153357 RepID=UPI000F59E69F|nr:CYTH domain-containing protein [Taibaiella sp. KBW10]RQO31230.1 adenylate cyclase [Taibaiella sp. KBW10]